MKRLFLAAAITLLACTGAYAASPACEAQATDKKLSGAAKTSFVQKCEKDAAATAQKLCGAQAKEKKLSGAAKTSFEKKCVTDNTDAVAKAESMCETQAWTRSWPVPPRPAS